MKDKEKNQEKKNIKIRKKHIIIAVIILLATVYITYKVINLIKNPSDTFFVEQGKIYEEENVIGYIIRDEQVVKGENYKNGILQIKAEGEKIAKGEAIFRYYSNKEENLVKKIKELDTKIDEAMANENTLFSSDLKVLENQIEEKLDKTYNINDLQKIKEYKKEINTSITKKAKIAGDKSPAGSYLKKLIDERKKYENELNSGAEFITAPKSGVVSYKVDGYEDKLTTDNFNYLTKNFLKGLKLKIGQVVATSQESGKIIDNFKSYIACVLNSKDAKQAKVRRRIKVKTSKWKRSRNYYRIYIRRK